ncbi:Putative oligomeric Golgi complex, subunit 3 protein [Septoria linicola]|uniref:Conserved oligomeric Golgi complex subunit 3 n=1 Tax=Septoria linicola TaxID=215465 RepID=A0A9Q9EPX7_9PEZI|nr:putative oligomeric Golgi complex, subunit 3 protein [Septoria linicola]USW59236.1 Putative oligomeric Golgi complex, subunit 3 protein [Septoria linicola]
MDDAWFHTLTAASTTARDKPQHTRRASLLQQPAEEKADVAIEPIQEIGEDDNAWSGPPQASIARRAQSYSDFYHVATAFSKKEDRKKRKNSLGTLHDVVLHQSAELDFEAEYSAAEELLLNESHAEHQAYLEQLELSHTHLDNLLASTMSTLGLLSALSDSFKAVEAQTEAFRQQCEDLVVEQRRLAGLADAIDENAQYYAYLEPMTRRLNAPGAANLVKGNDFLEMLSNLDNCVAYMESHPQHKEAATYRSRYRLLLTRGLTLIRHYFTKSLGEIAADISKRIQGGQLKETTHSAILYAKFRVPAPEMKSLGLEIQKRAVPTPDDVDAGREPEYLSLLRELYQSYSTTRGRLILPLVAKKMAELAADPQQADVLAFAKSSLSFVRGICLDEYDLWFEWFETEGALYDFLESLLEPMYDYLRPRTIHETKMEKLCDLCAMIQGRYMDIDSEDDDDVESSVLSPSSNGRQLSRKLDFGNVIRPALEDAQTRLVFLALNVLRDSIENYKPKPEDLDFSPKATTASSNGTKKGPILSGKRESQTPSAPTSKAPLVLDEDIDDAESMFSKRFTPDTPATTTTKQWYPTLRKAIWLLRRIYRLVNSTVFDDLAHRIVHSTIASLLSASAQIISNNTSTKSLRSTPHQDAQLFLITHLLHLKQQIVAFDIEFIPAEVEFDFSSVTNTFYELRDRGTSLWNPASWVRLVGGAVVGGGLLPKVVENMLDAKAELDGRLRTVINEFVKGYAGHITAPVDDVATQAQKKKGGEEEFDGVKAVRTVRGLAEKDVPLLRAKLEEFVDDARTRETLVAAVRDQVMMSYEEFFDSYSEGKGKKLSRKGKGREDEVWGPDLFNDAMERVFQVGQVVGDDDDDGDSTGSGGVSD